MRHDEKDVKRKPLAEKLHLVCKEKRPVPGQKADGKMVWRAEISAIECAVPSRKRRRAEMLAPLCPL